MVMLLGTHHEHLTLCMPLYHEVQINTAWNMLANILDYEILWISAFYGFVIYSISKVFWSYKNNSLIIENKDF